MSKILKKYGSLKTSIILTILIIIIASIFTYLFLYMYQGFVDAPGVILPIILPLLVILYPSNTFFKMLLRTEDAENSLRIKNKELKAALEEIEELSGLLPICSNCKKIRDDKGYWGQIENYLSEKSGLEFSHSICPDCVGKLYPKFNKGKLKDASNI